MTKAQKRQARKDYWNDNKVAILGSALALAGIVIAAQQYGIRQHNQYLKDHDLYEDYYTPEDSYE